MKKALNALLNNLSSGDFMKKIKAIGKVGSKGELYPNKKIREVVGIKPGQNVLYIATEDKLEVIPIKNFLELFDEKPLVKISVEEFERLTEEVLGSMEKNKK